MTTTTTTTYSVGDPVTVTATHLTYRGQDVADHTGRIAYPPTRGGRLYTVTLGQVDYLLAPEELEPAGQPETAGRR